MKQDEINRSPEDWLELIKEWQQSNMSAKSWCLKQNIPYKKFIYRKTRLVNPFCPGPQAPNSSFVELLDQRLTLSGLEIQYHNFSLKLQKDFDPSTLLSCLKVMEKL
ncbi:hypothetical protein H0W80_04920 [Candidatus Saccharibacteria bacterium]|nr:hypothetical protein [Candidatus Saccharibacteria bacterium]